MTPASGQAVNDEAPNGSVPLRRRSIQMRSNRQEMTDVFAE